MKREGWAALESLSSFVFPKDRPLWPCRQDPAPGHHLPLSLIPAAWGALHSHDTPWHLDVEGDTCSQGFFLSNGIREDFFFFLGIPLFLLFIYLFIFGCVGSSFLCEGFLQLRQAGATHYRGLSCCRAQAPDAQAQ